MFKFDLPSAVMKSLRRLDRNDLIDKLVGLSLSPEYQSNHLRILTLVQVALVKARRGARVKQGDLVELLNGLRNHACFENEDPAEDVFVSAVSTAAGQFRILNGVYPASDFSLQRLLDSVLSQEFSERVRFEDQSQALLILSEALANRCGLSTNSFQPSEQWRTRWPLRMTRILELGQAAHFSREDLIALGIDRRNLEPFCLNSVENLLERPFGDTALSRRPLLAEGSGVWLPVPSFVSPALRLHLAHAIADGTIPEAATGAFHEAQVARWLAYDLPLRKNKMLVMADLSLPESEVTVPGLSQSIIQFDEDKLAHLLVIEADWSHPPECAIHETKQASAALEREFADHINRSHAALQNGQKVDRGLTLVVYDSPGWNVNFELPDDLGPDWFCVGLSAYSLAALLRDPRFTLLEMWKMLREKRVIQNAGIHVGIWPDMLAHWSIWQTFDASFWPKAVDLRSFGGIFPDTSKIIDVVLRGRGFSGAHAALLPSRQWHRVERWIEEDPLSGEFAKPIFIDPIALAVELRGVLESEHGSWWVVVARPPFDLEDRRFLFLLWQAGLEWLFRIARTAGVRLADSRGPLEIRLLPVPKTIQDAHPDIELVPVEDAPVVTIIVPPPFIGTLATVDNAGEATFVGALVDGVLAAYDVVMDASARREWIQELVADPALKMIHVTLRSDALAAVDLIPDRIPLRFLQTSDLGVADRHMQDELAKQPNSGVSLQIKHIQGRTAVHDALNAAVDVHWMRCRAQLSGLDRIATLDLVSRMIEAVHRDRVDAEHGALARTRLYADSSEYDSWAKLRMGKRDGAFNVYRVVAEMALCESAPTGGRRPGVSDIDAIAAEVWALIQLAHFSDGVMQNLVTPEFDFRPDGTIVPKNGGVETFLRDYIAASLGESIALDIDAYPSLFDVAPADLSDARNDESGFLAAFESEFGISLENAAMVVLALQAVAADRESDVVVLHRSAIEAKLRQQEKAPKEEVLIEFLKAFGLPERSAWDDAPPAPFRRDDVWPWFFERRLSLMVRPVMCLFGDSDPLLVYGVRQLDMGVRYSSILLEKGIWPKEKLQSRKAQAYVDSEGNRRGTEFERQIATVVRNAGWFAFEAVRMRRLRAPDQLGEVDILAISPAGDTWIVIECKWFGAARTPREVANWLQDFRGRGGDKLEKHLGRFEWIRKHVPEVSEALGIQALPATIIPKIVTTSPVPLAFTANLPAGSEVLTRRELQVALNEGRI